MLTEKRVTTESQATTVNATYLVSSTVSNGMLESLSVAIQAPVEQDVNQEQIQGNELGSVRLEGDYISMYNMPYTDKFGAYMTDINLIITEVKNGIIGSV